MTVLGGVWAFGDGLDSWSDHSLALTLDMSLDLFEPSVLPMGNEINLPMQRSDLTKLTYKLFGGSINFGFMSLVKLLEMMKDGEAWRTVHGTVKNQT